MANEYRQVKLSLKGKDTLMYCWIPKDLANKGHLVEGFGKTWIVEEVFSTIQPKEKLRTDWKVGGLS